MKNNPSYKDIMNRLDISHVSIKPIKRCKNDDLRKTVIDNLNLL